MRWLQNEVRPNAPLNDSEMCMWLRWQVLSRAGDGVLAQLLYGSHLPDQAPHIWLFQMMYMTPIRRAIAKVWPALSVASRNLITEAACAAWTGLRTEFIQSTARPS